MPERQSASPLDLALAANDRSEHDKLLAVQDKSQAIGEFIDYCGRIGLVLCERPHTRRNQSQWPHPTSRTIQSILAEWFDIDLKKLEEEKRAMMAAMAAMNQRPLPRASDHEGGDDA